MNEESITDLIDRWMAHQLNSHKKAHLERMSQGNYTAILLCEYRETGAIQVYFVNRDLATQHYRKEWISSTIDQVTINANEYYLGLAHKFYLLAALKYSTEDTNI
jgi:hypothetical protein